MLVSRNVISKKLHTNAIESVVDMFFDNEYKSVLRELNILINDLVEIVYAYALTQYCVSYYTLSGDIWISVNNVIIIINLNGIFIHQNVECLFRTYGETNFSQYDVLPLFDYLWKKYNIREIRSSLFRISKYKSHGFKYGMFVRHFARKDDVCIVNSVNNIMMRNTLLIINDVCKTIDDYDFVKY